MRLSNIQAVGLALIPGVAEILQNDTTLKVNRAWSEMAEGVINARNALYCTVALTAIAAIATIMSEDNTTRQYACLTGATLGAGLITLAAKRLYDATSFIQQATNFAACPS